MFSHIENTFNLKSLSYFDHNYNGTTRPETPIYFHRILHSNFAVFEYDMYIVGQGSRNFELKIGLDS